MGRTSERSARSSTIEVLRRVLMVGALSAWTSLALAASGAASAPVAAVPPGHPTSAATKKTAPAPVKLVDINGASRKELKTLPGVDDALADKIVANRPYLSKAELVSKGVIAEGPYVALKNKVVALQKIPPKAQTSGKAAPPPASSAPGKAAGKS